MKCQALEHFRNNHHVPLPRSLKLVTSAAGALGILGALFMLVHFGT